MQDRHSSSPGENKAMPTIFLSYAREELEQAGEIEHELVAVGIAVWRDEVQLRAGQNWPKALGEAIAASDALVVLWSSRAAQSSFVELEWSTALALQKMILPCLLDRSPLPPSLAAIEAIQPNGIPEIAGRIALALSRDARSPDQLHTQKVLYQLGEISGGNPTDDVLRKAKAAFAQNGWTVQGNVYQAAGDIHIATSPSPPKTTLGCQASVAIVTGAALVVITVGIPLVRNIHDGAPSLKPPIEAGHPDQQQILAGSIWDDDGEPLASVKVSVLLGDRLLASGVTDGLGRFRLQVLAPEEAEVTVLAQRDRYQTEKRYTRLGNPAFNFKMRRK